MKKIKDLFKHPRFFWIKAYYVKQDPITKKPVVYNKKIKVWAKSRRDAQNEVNKRVD